VCLYLKLEASTSQINSTRPACDKRYAVLSWECQSFLFSP
jgi:hypothetical protein